MVKHLALLSFICILFSCCNRKDSNLAQLIKGDWLGQKQSEGFEHDQTEFMTFEDSTLRTFPWHDVLNYQIYKGAVYLLSKRYNKKGPRNKFKIVKLTTDSLVLLSSKKNTVRYSRLHPKNNITPTAIYFASSGCFGSCPVMRLEIDSNRNIRFYGLMHTAITEGYTGKLPENVYNSIIRKIRNLPVDSLKEYYAASYSDSRTLGIAIAHGNKVTRSSSYGHENEPMELYILFSHLLNLYKEVSLQPDSLVNWESFITHPQLRSMTDLLAPPINLPTFTPPKLDN